MKFIDVVRTFMVIGTKIKYELIINGKCKSIKFTLLLSENIYKDIQRSIGHIRKYKIISFIKIQLIIHLGCNNTKQNKRQFTFKINVNIRNAWYHCS